MAERATLAESPVPDVLKPFGAYKSANLRAHELDADVAAFACTADVIFRQPARENRKGVVREDGDFARKTTKIVLMCSYDAGFALALYAPAYRPSRMLSRISASRSSCARTA